jgi:hypothetical protein
MNEDIIPIAYMSGTGGHFLCHLLVSAKKNIKKPINFSEYGNAHAGLKDIHGPKLGPNEADMEKINYILSRTNTTIGIKPYFTAIHINDTELLGMYFSRFIRITYELDDVDELAKVFLGKHGIDCFNIKPTPTQLKFYLNKDKTVILKGANYFSHTKKYPSALFVTWKELYHGDSSFLIHKLHRFTEIPIENFDLDSLLSWRDATKNGIDMIEEILNGQENTQ